MAVLLFSSWVALYGLRPGPKMVAPDAVVNIPRGSSLQTIATILATNGIISEDVRFLILAKIFGYSGMLQAGEFLLETGRKPLEVLKTLASAKSIQYSITIPEGLRATEIAAIFVEGSWFDPKSFANLLVDKEFMAKHGLTGLDSLEGYLYPDTYILTRDARGAEKIMGLMISRFNKVWAEISAQFEEKPDRQKTVILASMVEKETGAAAERPLIAGVFLNRLQLGMRLQSDPTVVYSLENHSGAITRSDLQNPTPYNTYTVAGLPAGPICSPGKEALLAVLAPTQTKDLYFVSKNDGTHHFSATLAEHNSAVQKYQRKKSGEKGK
ncbi:MAG: endolytic transglycosylase MltG [Proteobacteria bacterium]|nr:endolytic transglycosylase MltG [Pseudomonadota bacterium]